MVTQITVRLPDELVAFIDDCVAHGRAESRSAVVSAALDRARRSEIAERDAGILARSKAGDDFDDLASFSARVALDDLA
ncbi:MAG: ribbon-helix-helix domain-containing protein [Acidimicrobiales bacterium]